LLFICESDTKVKQLIFHWVYLVYFEVNIFKCSIL